jgi:outer membrane protein assembly factor BamB
VPGGPSATPAFLSDSSAIVPAVDCTDWDWDDIWYCAVYRPRLYAAPPAQRQLTLIFSSPSGGYYQRLSSPSIGRGDAIYVAATVQGGAQLYRLDADGTERWSVPLECCFASMPAIGPGGNVYVETAGGSRPALVHAVSPTGKVRWRTKLANDYYPVYPLAVGADGTIYGGVFKGVVHALSPDGSIRWSTTLDAKSDYPAPAIGPDGSVILLENRLDYSDWSYHQKMIAIGPGPGAR